MKLKVKHQLLLRIMFAYIVIILILFLAIGGYSYYKISSNNSNVVNEQIQSNIEQEIKHIDYELSRLYDVSLMIYLDTVYSSFINIEQPIPISYSADLTNASKRLHVNTTNEFIDNLTLYYPNSEMFVSNLSVGTNPEVYYKTYFSDFDMSYDSFKERLLLSNDEFISMLDTSTDAANLFFYYPIGNRNNPDIIALFEISSDKFIYNIDNALTYENYSYTVHDEYGNIVMQIGNIDIGGDNVLVNTLTSEINNWSYTYSVDKTEVDYYLRQVSTTIVVLYIVVLIFSILLALFFANMVANPIIDIYDKLDIDSKCNKKNSIWQNLKESVFDMANNHSSLEKLYVDYCRTIEENFIRRLLTGYVFATNELQNLTPSIYEFMSYTNYSVSVIKFDRDHNNISSSLLSINMLKNFLVHLNLKGNILDVNNNCVLIISCVCSHDKEYYVDIYQKIQQHFSDNNVVARICVGGESDTCDKIYIPFQQAMALNDYLTIVDDEIIYFDQISNPNSVLSYTIDNEHQLIQLILTSNYYKAIEIVHAIVDGACSCTELKRSRFVLRSLMYSMERLKYRILTLSEETVNMIDFNISVIEVVLSNTQLDKQTLMEAFDTIVLKFTDNIHAVANEKNSFIEKIKKYIHMHYTSENLCVSEIANAMSFSENYISSSFKQQTNQNISSYIEKYRLEKALELLKDTDDTVQKICSLVGYSNVNTFNKAFKRNYNCTPIEYRKKYPI